MGSKTMDQKPQNPLARHFRQPALYITLPSKGAHWPENSLELTATGEIPVYPMTVKDELTIRTPDALLNGQGVVDVIHSCCPNIKDAWKMPSMDVDYVLLNIRIASYGNKMGIETKCPKCEAEATYDLDLSGVLEKIGIPDYTVPVQSEGLTIKLQPQQYFAINRANQITFTEQQILRTINDDAVSDEDKKARTDAYLNKLIDLNVDICTNSTESITMEDGTRVTESEFIKEFYNNSEFKIMRQVQNALEEINKSAGIQPIDHKCAECNEPYRMPIEFDYASFFA